MDKIKENVKKFAPDSIVANAGVNNPLTSVGFNYDLLEKNGGFYVGRNYKDFGFSMEVNDLYNNLNADQCFTVGLPKSYKQLNDLFINETNFVNKILKFSPVSGSITGCANNKETSMCVNGDVRVKYLFEVGLSACWTFNNEIVKEFLNDNKSFKKLLVNSDETLQDFFNKKNTPGPEAAPIDSNQTNRDMIAQRIENNILDPNYKKAYEDTLKIDKRAENEKREHLNDNRNKENNYEYENQAYKYVNFQIDSNTNLFFTKHSITAKLYDSNNDQLLASETRKFFELSSHSKNAIHAAKSHLTSALLNNLFSDSSNQIRIGEISKKLVIVTGEGFLKSYMDEKILKNLNSPLSNSLAGGLVDAGFAILHGHADNAIRTGFVSTANRLTQNLIHLPLSYSSSRFVSTSDLFGRNLISVDSSRHNLNMKLVSDASVGIHYEKAYTVFKNSDGFTVHQKSSGLGAHISYSSVFDASVGWMSGYEVSEPLIEIRGNTQMITTYERSFDGQLRVSIGLGDKRSSFNILPAFASETKKTINISNVDGTPLEVRDGLPLKYLNQNKQNTINDSPNAANTNSDINNNNNDMIKSQVKDNNQSVNVQASDGVDKSIQSQHVELVGKLFEPYMQKPNGRVESTLGKDIESTHKDKFWHMVSDKSSTKVFEYGTATETFVEEVKTRVVGDEMQSSVSFHEANSKFQDLLYDKYVKHKVIGKNKVTENTYQKGEKRTENLKNKTDIDLTLYGKVDGSAYEVDVDLGEQEIEIPDGTKIKGFAKANLNYKYDININKQDLEKNVVNFHRETNGIGEFILTENKLNETTKMRVEPIDNTNNINNNKNPNQANAMNYADVDFRHTYDVHAKGIVECNLSETTSSSDINNGLQETINRQFNGQNDTLDLKPQEIIHETNKIYTVDSTTTPTNNNKSSFLVHRNVEGGGGKTIDDYVHAIKDTHLQVEKISPDDNAASSNIQQTATHTRTAYGVRVENRVTDTKGVQSNGVFTYSSQETVTKMNRFTETGDIIKEDSNFLKTQVENNKLTVEQTPFRTIAIKQETNDSLFLEKRVKTVSDTLIDDGAPSVEEKTFLNSATQRAGGTLAGGVANLFLKKCEGKEIKKGDLGKLAVSTVESFGVGHASNLVACTKGVGKQLGIVSAVAAGAAVCNTVKTLMDKDDKRSCKEKLAWGAMEVAPAVVQVGCAAKNFAYASGVCGAVSVAVESAHCAVDVYKGDKTKQDLAETVITSAITTGVGTLAAYGASSACTAVLGTAASSGIALTAVGMTAAAATAGMIIIPAVCCSLAVFGTTKLFSYFVQKIKYKSLCHELGLDTNATDEELRTSFRKAALKVHPDKGGNINDFNKLVDDYKKLSEFRSMLKISEFQKVEKEKDKNKKKKPTWNAWFYTFLDNISKPFETNCDEVNNKSGKEKEKKGISYKELESNLDSFIPDSENFKAWKEKSSNLQK